MNRRTLLKTVGATGLLGLGVGAGAAATAGDDSVEAQGCNFVCCEDCRIAYCPNGCDCERNCGDTIRRE